MPERFYPDNSSTDRHVLDRERKSPKNYDIFTRVLRSATFSAKSPPDHPSVRDGAALHGLLRLRWGRSQGALPDIRRARTRHVERAGKNG
jgi:hypothetical protein